MRKLYSLVLMAAGLLIGTNSWAGTIEVSESSGLQSAIANANDGDVVAWTGGTLEGNKSLWLGTGNHVILDLGGKTYSFTASTGNNFAIAVSHGTLEIRNGKIDGTGVEDLIRVYGTTEKIDAKANAGDAYSRVIVRESATLSSSKNVIAVDVMRSDQPAKFGQTWSTTNFVNCALQSNNFGLANGVRIDVEGKLSAQKYGLKVNGMVRDPHEFSGWTDADRIYTPYIYITSTGYVSTSPTATEATAAYSSGYGRWQVEGYCGGSTGLYAKSGEIILENAIITSTNSEVNQPAGKGHGIDAGGSAIVIESNQNFSGNVSITIKGNTEVSATAGYAIEETITTANESKVDLIKIESGTISGGDKGAIIVEDKTVQDAQDNKTGKVVVAGGNVTGEVVVDQNSGTGEVDQEGPRTLVELDLTGGDENPNNDLTAYITTTGNQNPTAVTVGDNQVIVFGNPEATTESYNVTLNDYYLATFSALKDVEIPAGINAYTAGVVENDVLQLSAPITGKIPAGTGVILYNPNENNKNIVLEVTTGASALGANNLKPAAAWTVNYSGAAYILHDKELYLYTGLRMKENKAFLVLPEGNSDSEEAPINAPKRISLRFNQTEQTTAIDNVANEAVKAVKFVGEDGKLYIRRGEAVYTVQGQLVK